MKLGEAIKFAKPDLFELSEARKEILCKSILDSNTDTLGYIAGRAESELQDREMRKFNDECEWRNENGDIEKLEMIRCAIQEVIKLDLPSGLDEEMDSALELVGTLITGKTK